MPVRDEDAAHLLPVLHEVTDVGNDQIDPRQFVIREGEPRVDDDDVVAALYGGHVFPDLADAAQKNHLYGVFALFRPAFFLFRPLFGNGPGVAGTFRFISFSVLFGEFYRLFGELCAFIFLRGDGRRFF